MGMSTFNLGFAGGVTIRGVPLVQTHPGKTVWVGNATASVPVGGLKGSDGNPGTFLKPYATISKALAQSVASRGDIIFVKPGHTENVSDATTWSLNTAGVAIVGLGTGALRPTLTLDTGTTSTINVVANNISISNILFLANFAAIASVFTTTTAADFAIDSCEFRDLSAILNFAAIVTTDTTSNDTDGLSITNSKVLGLGTTASTTVVSMLGTNRRLVISNNYTQNLCVTDGAAVLKIATGKVVTDMVMSTNIFNVTGVSSASAGILITTNGSTNSGVISDNYIHGLDTTSAILATGSSGFVTFQNFYVHTADKSGFLVPGADS